MNRTTRKVACLSTISFAFGLCSLHLNAEVLNISGTWKLNVKKSHIDHPPKSFVMKLDHKEPQLKYSWTITEPEGSRTYYEWGGAIDGKAYPQTKGPGSGVVKKSVRRNGVTSGNKNESLQVYTWTTFSDGKPEPVGTNSWTFSKRGTVLTNRFQVTGDDGRRTDVIEFFEKE